MPPETSMPYPSSREVAAHHALYLDREGEIAACDASIAELSSRRAALQQRLDKLKVEQPTVPTDSDDDLATALAADPSAELDHEAFKERAEQHATVRAAVDVWRANVKVLEKALAKLDAEIGTAEGKLRDRKSARHEAWAAFVMAGHKHAAGKFRDGFIELRKRYVEPMLGFAALRYPDTGNEIIGRTAHAISGDSFLRMEILKPGTRESSGGYVTEDLHVPQRITTAQRDAFIERFVETLPSPSGRPR